MQLTIFPIAGGGTLTFRLYKNSLSNANIINEIEVNLSAIDSTNSQFFLEIPSIWNLYKTKIFYNNP
jgi:surfactin synthase thioesterase subunit